MLMSLAACGSTEQSKSVPEDNSPLAQTARWLIKNTGEPAYGNIGGEWLMLALSRSGKMPEGWVDSYYASVEEYVKSCGGVLDAKRYTEYSRLILALTAIGKDPANVAGYDLLAPLGDFDQTNFQGINGTAYALLALDSGDYEVPACPDGAYQASREEYVAVLLERQSESGGWGFMGSNNADADGTVMILQALAAYKDDALVAEAIDAALAMLSALQDEKGGFGDSCETVAQAIIALCELGVSLQDERFVKNGRSLSDRLMDFSTGEGAFSHAEGQSEANAMSTEQAFCALTAMYLQQSGKGLYTM